MGIAELFEIGFLEALWNWSSPWLTIAVYLCIGIGFAAQFALCKWCRIPILKWIVAALCVVGCIACEFAWHRITGWDRLGVDFVYGAILCILLGVLIAALVSFITKRSASEKVVDHGEK